MKTIAKNIAGIVIGIIVMSISSFIIGSLLTLLGRVSLFKMMIEFVCDYSVFAFTTCWFTSIELGAIVLQKVSCQNSKNQDWGLIGYGIIDLIIFGSSLILELKEKGLNWGIIDYVILSVVCFMIIEAGFKGEKLDRENERNEETIIEEEKTNSIENIFCRKCGAKLDSNSKFCNKCGTEVIHTEE